MKPTTQSRADVAVQSAATPSTSRPDGTYTLLRTIPVAGSSATPHATSRSSPGCIRWSSLSFVLGLRATIVLHTQVWRKDAKHFSSEAGRVTPDASCWSRAEASSDCFSSSMSAIVAFSRSGSGARARVTVSIVPVASSGSRSALGSPRCIHRTRGDDGGGGPRDDGRIRRWPIPCRCRRCKRRLLGLRLFASMYNRSFNGHKCVTYVTVNFLSFQNCATPPQPSL
jgi:hypothetical protein